MAENADYYFIFYFFNGDITKVQRVSRTSSFGLVDTKTLFRSERRRDGVGGGGDASNTDDKWTAVRRKRHVHKYIEEPAKA